MGLKYIANGQTYDLSSPQYTDIRGAKRLNYIASGKTYQLGLATDKTCSQYSPLVMRINGANYYIGRSTSTSGSSSSYSTNRIISTYMQTIRSRILTKTYYNNKFFLSSQRFSYTNATISDPLLPYYSTSYSRFYGKSGVYTTTKPPKNIKALAYYTFGNEGLYAVSPIYGVADGEYSVSGTFYGGTFETTSSDYNDLGPNHIRTTEFMGVSTQMLYIDYTGSTSSSQYTIYTSSTSSSYKTYTVSTSLITSTSSHNFV